MSKETFLEKLRKKLSILEESEIEDILNEYEGYIEEKIKKGSSEEEAVKSMGNIDELARDLLSAYKIKNPNGKDHEGISSLVDSFVNIFDRIISVFAHKSFNEIVKFVIELIFIFLIIAICKIPFEIIGGMGRGIFSSLGNTGYHILFGIWNFILEFAYLIFAILLFIKIFESRYLSEEYESVFSTLKKEDSKNVKKQTGKHSDKEEVIKEKVVYKEKKEHQSFGIIDSLTKVCILFMKFILLFFLLGVACYIIGMAMALGISVYLMIKGVFYIGIYLILISLFAIGIIAFIFLFNFIFDHKNKVGVLLISSLVSFVLLGIGTGICALEFASTTFIYSDTAENLKREEYKFDMQENLVLARSVYNFQNVIVDDSLKREIKVVYTYNDRYLDIEAEPYIGKEDQFNLLHTSYIVRSFKYTKEYFDSFVDNLKNKTIVAHHAHNVDIKIYVSNEVLNELKENEIKQEKANFPEDIEDICDDLARSGYSLPHYCEPYYYNHHNM